jgi:hypothetical protein
VQADGPRQLINCGGGGAYTAATHHLPEKIAVPPKHSQVRRESPQRLFKLAKTYPSKARSRWLGGGVFARLPWRNPGFAALLGILHTLLLMAFQNENRRVITVPIFLMVVLIMAATTFFAVGLSAGQQKFVPFLLGGIHGAAHVALGAGAWVLWKQFPLADLPWPWPPVAAAIIYLPIAGVVATLLVSLYLLIASRFKVNLNELFAGQGIEDYKSFLRMRIAPDGSLTLYAVGLDKISKKWVPQMAGSWFGPATPLKARLVDDPVVFAPVKTPDAAPHTPSGLSTPTL